MTINKRTLFFFLLTSFHGRLIATSTVNIQSAHGVGHMENHGTVHQHIHVQQQEFICNLASTLMERFIYQPRTSPDGQDYITLIATQLERDVTNICGLNLKGMGGVGKSTLAYEYARQHRNNPYKLIWFFRCETKESFEQSLKSLYSRFFPTQISETIPFDILKGAVYDKLHGYQDKILLIYDNVVDQKSLSDKLIRGSSQNMHIIITSRQTVRANNQILLGVFIEQESIECLQKEIRLCNPDYSHDLEESQLKEVAQSLGYLPLAVVQAAAYIATKEIALQDFIKRFEEKDKDFLDYDDDQQAIPRSFYKLFLIALEALNNDEKELLYMLSYLNPDDISAVFFDGQKAALETLKRYSLIRYEQNQISVHRLLQLVGREESKINKEKIIEDLLGTFEAFLEDHLPKDPKQGFSLLQNMKGQLIALKSYQENSKLEDLLKQINDQLFDYLLECLDQDNTDELTTDKLMRQYLEISEEDFNHQKIRLKPILDCFKKVSDRFDVISFTKDIEKKDFEDLISYFFKMKSDSSSSEELLYNLFALFLIDKSKWEEECSKPKRGTSWIDEIDNIWSPYLSQTDGITIPKTHKDELFLMRYLEVVRKMARTGNPKFLGLLGFLYYSEKFSSKNEKKAVSYFKKAAEQGEKNAQFILGVLYEKGNCGMEINPHESFKWYAEAAKQEYAPAQYSLADCYEKGLGVQQDYEKASKWYAEAEKQEYPLAAERGYALAQYRKGVSYEKGLGIYQSYEESFKCYAEAAERGCVLAQYSLGIFYEKGLGIYQSYEESFGWYLKAAEQGYGPAIYTVGLWCAFGDHISRDFKMAFEVWMHGASIGNSDSQFYLGRLYEEGCGVEQSYETAFKWFTKAAFNENANAQVYLGLIYEKGSNGVEQSYEIAFKWYTKAAEQSNADGQTCLGVLYEKGLGVEQSYETAFKWFTKAAEQGHASGQTCLGVLYEKGLGVEQSYEIAFKWFTKAAEQGHANGQTCLGEIYEKGLGMKQSYETAVEWFTKAAWQGNLDAQLHLGVCYEKGLGVDQSSGIAISLFTMLAEEENQQAQFYLGESYMKGQGISQDFENAIELFIKAAEQGYAPAQQRLRELEEQMAKETESEGLSKEDTDYFVKEALKQKELSAIKVNQPTVEIDLDDI